MSGYYLSYASNTTNDYNSASTGDVHFYYGNSTCDSASTADGVYTPTGGWYYITHEAVEAKPETKVEAKARQRREREYRIQLEQDRKQREREQRELQKEKEDAIKKAEELIREHIGAIAFGKMVEVGYIELDSQKYEGRKYRIPAKDETFIEVLDKDDRVIDTLCVHSPGNFPMYDKVLARYVRLSLDEEEILKVANSHGARQRSVLARVSN